MAKFTKKTFAPAVGEREEMTAVDESHLSEEKVAEEILNKMIEEVIPDAVQEEKEKVAEVVVLDVPTHETVTSLFTLKRVFFGDKYFDLVEGEPVSLPVGVVFELRERGIVE